MSTISSTALNLFYYICVNSTQVKKNSSDAINTGKYIKIDTPENSSKYISILLNNYTEEIKTSNSFLKCWKEKAWYCNAVFYPVIYNNTLYYMNYNMVLNNNFEILIYIIGKTINAALIYINPKVFLKKGIFETFIASKLYPALLESSDYRVKTELSTTLYEVPKFKNREELNEALDIMKKELYKKEQLFTDLFKNDRIL